MARINISRRSLLALGGAATASALGARGALAAERQSVVIVGAGLAGLGAALTLRDAGVDVTVLEGSSRIGGRVWTRHDLEGRPELGASQIGRSYSRVIALCQRFGLTLVPERRDIFPSAMNYRGQWINPREWAASPLNEMQGEERALAPNLVHALLLDKYNRLKTLEDWLDPAFADLDVSVVELLRRHGHSPQAIDFATRSGGSSGPYATSALALMQETTRNRFDIAFGRPEGAGAERGAYGFVNQRDQLVNGLALISNIEGGTQRLTDAMAAALGDQVRTGKIVYEIDMSGAKALVRCMDGTSYAADRVIYAGPFNTLRRVQVRPFFEGAQAQAISELGVGQTTRAFLMVREPYWEQDGLSPSFFTDGPLQQLWIINDGSNSRVRRAMAVMTGGNALRIDMMDAETFGRFVVSEIERLRPAAKGKVDFITGMAWGKVPLIGACRHLYAPGQVTRFAKPMVAPWKALHLAGEHTRRLDFGMEAALESGERAAMEVLDALG
jgi:monoamine oxidase